MSDGKYLAYWAEVVDKRPVKKAKNLEIVILDNGRGCVVRKDDRIELEDTVVYISPGAVLPQIEEFEYMRPYGFVVSKRKIMGATSNGMVLTTKCVRAIEDKYIGDRLMLSALPTVGCVTINSLITK